jgi:hypothetical protein
MDPVHVALPGDSGVDDQVRRTQPSEADESGPSPRTDHRFKRATPRGPPTHPQRAPSGSSSSTRRDTTVIRWESALRLTQTHEMRLAWYTTVPPNGRGMAVVSRSTTFLRCSGGYDQAEHDPVRYTTDRAT